jgi:hypothetical protein
MPLNPYSREEGTVGCLRNLAEICADLKIDTTLMDDEAAEIRGGPECMRR